MLYNAALHEARNKNIGITINPLTEDQIDAIQVHLKTKYKPFATYWEYLCPSNNTTFMVYDPKKNPFLDYDFNLEVPNPLTRKHGVTDPKYKKHYQAKIYKGKK